MAANSSFGSMDAEGGSSSYQDQEGASLLEHNVVASKGSGAPKKFRHGILLACMSGMALSAFIYAMPSKTVAVANADATGSSAEPVVDIFEIADVAEDANIVSEDSIEEDLRHVSEMTEDGDFCGTSLATNKGAHDYKFVHGGFDYNMELNGKKCLAKSKWNKNDILACGVDQLNVEANVTFLMAEASDSLVSAVGLRANKNDGAPASGFCKGHEQYLCVPSVKVNDDGDDLIKLKMQQCTVDTSVTTGSVDEFMVTEGVTFDYSRWYTTSFSAVGSTLECQLYDDTGSVVLSAAAGVGDYHSVIYSSGDVTFGGYGQQFYFSDVSIGAGN